MLTSSVSESVIYFACACVSTDVDPFRDRVPSWYHREPALTAAKAHSIGAGMDDDQPRVVQLPFESIERAARDILRLGLDAEAVNPPELVRHIARTITELASRYHS
jgi:predicted DNA-binding transcriptional regulator YafY